MPSAKLRSDPAVPFTNSCDQDHSAPLPSPGIMKMNFNFI
jgi:hypothetical protein